jgi:UDP-N-acetylmuramate dehydrogenase
MNKLRVYQNRSFKDLTTFHIGGKINYYLEIKDKDEVCEAAVFAKEKGLSIFILGGGSDILVNDKDFEGVVVKYVGKNLKFLPRRQAGKTQNSKVFVTAEAGLEWDKLVEKVVKRNLQGIECLSGIPGTVGASIIQNIGAYGQEVKDSLFSLTAFDLKKGVFVEFSNKDCELSYRSSFFKKPQNWQKFIICEATFKLNPQAKPSVTYNSLKSYLSANKISNPTLREVRDAVLAIRSEKFEKPVDTGNAGSFFKNPTISAAKFNELKSKFKDMPSFKNPDGTYKCFAAWFIEKCGWKGRTYKGAGVSPKHALVLINKRDATAKDVFDLSEKIINDVYKKFEIKLEREVQLVNF